MSDAELDFAPQPGPQSAFAATAADIAVFGGAAGAGKALSLETPIPTPTGWTAMADLRPGDAVFGGTGQPCRILFVHPVITAEAYRIVFDDGSTVDANAEHEWWTLTASDLGKLTRRDDDYRASRRSKRGVIPSRASGRKSQRFTDSLTARNKARSFDHARLLPPPTGSLRTTREIADTLQTRSGRANHAVPVAEPLCLPSAILPLHPYLLGVWLGDGNANGGMITTADPDIVESFRQGGMQVRHVPSSKYGWRVDGLTAILRRIGLLGHKAVPSAYLRGSSEQRLAILQGLMDTDGFASDRGSVEFTSTNRSLAESVAELARSLGSKTRVSVGRATLNGKDCGPKYRINWSPDYPAFRLHRKLSRQKHADHRRTTKFRYIVSCEQIDPTPVRCITVDNPTGLFLCGKGFVPTHNSWGMLFEALRHKENPNFGAVMFRRTYKQVKNEGGLWDTSQKIYPYAGAVPRETDLSWEFPSRASVTFAHMQAEKDRYQWDGAQIPLICFDQLEHFTKRQFWYMLSRNRSTCGVKPYIRATCNPDPDHWLRTFMAWWIKGDEYPDEERGFPIPERSGVVRWFVVVTGEPRWASSRQGLIAEYGPDALPKSFTFIPGTVRDNVILMREDPGYLANLQALSVVDRARLLGGNWDVRESAGTFYRREWFRIVEAAPPCSDWVRYWDRQSTAEEKAKPDGSWTVGLLMGRTEQGQYVIANVVRFQGTPLEVERAIKNTADQDGQGVRPIVEQDPGSSGVAEVGYHIRNLAGYDVEANPVRESKGRRAKPLSAQAEAGNVMLVRAAWNGPFLNEYENYDGTDKCVNDQIDAGSGAFYKLQVARAAGVW